MAQISNGGVRGAKAHTIQRACCRTALGAFALLSLATAQKQEELITIREAKGANNFQHVGMVWLDTQLSQMVFKLDLDKIFAQLELTKKHLAGSTLTSRATKIREVIQWEEEIRRVRRSIAKQSKIEKKSVLSWLGSFLGIFNTFQIHQVKGTVDNVKDASHKIVSEVDIVQQHLMTTDNNIVTLEKQLHKTQTDMWHFGQDNLVLEAWSRLEETMHTIEDIMTDLASHRLSHDLTKLFDVGKEWDKLEQQAARKGFKPIFDDWQFLFHLKTAFAIDNHNIIMAVQIPLVTTQQNGRQLLKLTNNPIHMSNKFYYPTKTNEFISVESLSHLAKPMAIDVYSQCENLNYQWFCYGSYVQPHQAPNTCSEAIWLGKKADFLRLCHLIAMEETERVIKLNDTTAIWYLTGAVEMVVSCGNGKHVKAYVNTTALITIKRGCRASTPNFTFNTARVETSDIRQVVNHLNEDKEDAKEDWSLATWELQRPGVIKRRAEEIDDLLRNAEPPLVPVWVAVLLAAIAIIIVTVFVIWLYIQARRQWSLAMPQSIELGSRSKNERKDESADTDESAVSKV